MANNIVERFHCTLKAFLKAHNDRFHWCVSTIGAFGPPHCACPSQLVYGTPLRPLGKLIGLADLSLSADPANYVTQLTTAMQTLQATTSRKQPRQSLYISDELNHCTQPYDSPFRVIECHNKHFRLDVHKRNDCIN